MAIPKISWDWLNLVLVLLSAILAEMRVSKTATKATLKAPMMMFIIGISLAGDQYEKLASCTSLARVG